MIDATETAFLEYRNSRDSEKRTIFELADKKYLEQLKNQDLQLFLPSDGYFRTMPYYKFSCTEFYADYEHGTFIPVEIEFFNSDFYLSGVKVHFTPDNTDGYTLIKGDINDLEHNPPATGFTGGYEGVDSDADYEIRNESLVPPYEKYYSTPLEAVSFTTMYRDQINWGIAIIVFCAFAFAFIPAVISYNIRMKRYQIFEYRRKMIDAMAHDLKTPMAAITAYAENLSGHIGSDKQEYYAGKIEEKVSEMNGMVNSILDFSKTENSSVKVKKEDVDIGALITGIISDNEHTVNSRSLKINYEQQQVMVKCDADLMKQALANLIGNAVIHCKEGSSIDISCGEKIIMIVNTIDEKIENIKDLKQPFAKGSSTRGSKGTGLGLAIADNNLAMLGFKLDLKTEDDKFIATVKM